MIDFAVASVSSRLIGLLVAGLVVALAALAPAEETGPQPYAHPHADDALVLRNSKAFVAVSPTLGRIVAFGPAGGPNLLWVGEQQDVAEGWKNYGGDKVWPSPQDDWPQTHGRAWPPTPGIDGPPWTLVASSPDTLVIESPVSPTLGIQVRREIQLFHNRAFLQVRTTLTRVAESDARVHVWPITQIVMPEYCLIEVLEKQSDDETFWMPGRLPATVMAISPLPSHFLPKDRIYRYDMPKTGSHKIASYGSFIAAVYPKWVLAQYVQPHDPQADYADSSNVQLFSNERYVELEVTSAAKKLQVGESLELTVDWLIFKRPAEATPAWLGNRVMALRPGPGNNRLLEMLEHGDGG